MEEKGGTAVLRGKEVSFTGRLASLTRREAAGLVEARGGRFAEVPTPRTSYLVVGQEGWPLRADGRLTRKLARARELKERGASISVLAEEVFLELLGLEEHRADIHRHYTTGQLSRILDLPGSTVRSWVRAGLIEPVRSVHRLCYFDFRQIAGAKALCELIRAGVALPRIRRSLVELKGLRIASEQPLLQLALIERDGCLLARLQGGALVEPCGQLRFDFSAASPREPIPLERDLPQEEWFDRALDCEEAGRLEDADRAYQAALGAGPASPELCFNHGNVLYALGKKEEACARFRQALGLDPEYVEAWNNLANVLAELGRLEDAVAAYHRAIAIEPHYADAHYNLAETLHQAGDAAGAAPHWRAYLKQDPRSSWAREALRRLASLERTS